MQNSPLTDLKPIDPKLRSIIIGSTLGDAGIFKSSATANARLEMSFGTNFKDFFAPRPEFMGSILSDFMSSPVKSVKIKGKNTTYLNYRLKTRSLPLWTYFHALFYRYDPNLGKYIKIVPIQILDFMDPIVLAFLIMTDGNFDCGRNRVRIYTNSFTQQEVQLLSVAIQQNLGITAAVLHDRKDQFILTIGARNLPLLRNTVATHFHPSMLYRLGL